MDYTKEEIDIAFINALKAIDADKEYEFEKEYQTALKDLAEAIFDIDFQNNDVEPVNNAY